MGPFGFHPLPYQPGYPTKMIIDVIDDQPQVIVLTGSRCGDGTVLRFWYDQGTPTGTFPLSDARMLVAGEPTARLSPAAKGGSHTGYLLFSGSGAWLLRLSDSADDTVGTLLITAQP